MSRKSMPLALVEAAVRRTITAVWRFVVVRQGNLVYPVEYSLTAQEAKMVRTLFSGLLCACIALPVTQADTRRHVPLHAADTSTFYVDGEIIGSGKTRFLVDTGSGYSAIDQDTLDRLAENGNATYVKTLEGIMADGSRKVVPVYRIAGIAIGDSCVIRDIEAAVFPTGSRQILGLSALRRVMPMEFSMEPPTISLSHCDGEAVQSDGLAVSGSAPELARFE